jgi:hypothetical protein
MSLPVIAQVKKYTWKHIIDTLIIPKGELEQEHYYSAIDYYCNFYSGDNPRILFPEESVKYIQAEIKDDAEHKIRLALNEKAREDLRESWPGLDTYIESLGKRGNPPF